MLGEWGAIDDYDTGDIGAVDDCDAGDIDDGGDGPDNGGDFHAGSHQHMQQPISQSQPRFPNQRHQQQHRPPSQHEVAPSTSAALNRFIVPQTQVLSASRLNLRSIVDDETVRWRRCCHQRK
jgi:hypothetical protein